MLRIEPERGEGNQSSRFEFVAGAPTRVVVGGVGGTRFLGLTPSLVLWLLWSEVSEGLMSVSGTPSQWIDFPLSVAQRVAHCAEPPSPGGDFTAVSSKDGARFRATRSRNCTTMRLAPAETVSVAMNDPTSLLIFFVAYLGRVVDLGFPLRLLPSLRFTLPKIPLFRV